MRGKVSKARRRLELKYTSKPLSGWGGLVALSEFFDQIGLRGYLEKALPDGRTSNNRVTAVDMVVQFLVTVLLGGKRFQHVDRIKDDETIRRIMDAKRFGSGSNLTRYLRNLTQGQGEHIDQALNELVMTGLRVTEQRDTLDLDSTVLQRYGSQEGAAKGYNPTRRGGKSHHPLAGMLARSKMVPHIWLRDGSASPHKGAVEFVQELLAKLPEGFVIEGLRADSGFYQRKLMDFLEDAHIPYAIVAKQSKGFAKWCSEQTGWRAVDASTEITEAMYVSPKSKERPRRMVITRTVRKEETDLFTVRDYDYHALATTYPGSAEQRWKYYLGRADCENRFRELKGDYNINGFCLQRFAGTEIALRLICFAYNLITIFKRAILRDSTPSLGTLRHSLLVIGASLGSSARTEILRLGLRGVWRTRFEALLETIRQWSSTAAQFRRVLETSMLEPPSCWRNRRSHMLGF